VDWQPARQVAADDLVIRTPERVSFTYSPAGLGSRFVAQLIDWLVLSGVLAAVLVAGSVATGAASASTVLGEAVLIVWIAAVGVLVFGYFPVLEGAWSGRTLGKAAMRLRAVDQRGGPLTVPQAIIRNLVRIVDFLPLFYALGAVTIFISGRSQRLGDLAAGTVVVQEQRSVTYTQLVAAGQRDLPASSPAVTPATAVAPARWTRPLDPPLKRFVTAYAQRRHTLHPEQRAQLAGRAEPALRLALPELVGGQGPLAALDRLADEEQTGWAG
jgi:uncharacterized RDD family membrane protein YckC